MHWLCYFPLFTDFVNLGQSRLSGLSLGAFIIYGGAFINFTLLVVESDRA